MNASKVEKTRPKERVTLPPFGLLAKLWLMVSEITKALWALSRTSFQPEVINDPKILVCSIGEHGILEKQASDDFKVYSAIYRNVRRNNFKCAIDFLTHIKNERYDVVHFLAFFNEDKRVIDGNDDATDFEVVTTARDMNVKWLFSAAENETPFTKTQFGPLPLHFVFTLKRYGETFNHFLERLLLLMAKGSSMPVAWVTLAPQLPVPTGRTDAPECVFATGRGQALFLP